MEYFLFLISFQKGLKCFKDLDKYYIKNIS